MYSSYREELYLLSARWWLFPNILNGYTLFSASRCRAFLVDYNQNYKALFFRKKKEKPRLSSLVIRSRVIVVRESPI